MLRFLTLVVFTLSAPLHADTCPSGDAAWINWGKSALKKVAGKNFAHERLAEIQEQFLDCKTELKAAPKAQACLANLNRFSRAMWWGEQSGHSLGLSMSDKAYYSSLPYPEMLEMPIELTEQTFLRQIDDGSPAALDEAIKRIDEVNKSITDPALHWRVLLYESQHLGPPDKSGALGRFFVWVPGKNFDRYLQFTMRNDPKQPQTTGLSIAALQKTDPKTKQVLAVPQARLKDFWRVRENGRIRIGTRLEEMGSMENCYSCHKHALLPITPNPKVFDKKRFAKALGEVNAEMAAVGKIETVGIDSEGYGPPMGPETWEPRDEKFIHACSNGKVTDPARVKRVLKAMQCASCHDGETRGALNYPSILKGQPEGKHSLVKFYVEIHKRMSPLTPDLNSDERSALVNCLKQEYYGEYDGKPGVLQQWLLPKRCEE